MLDGTGPRGWGRFGDSAALGYEQDGERYDTQVLRVGVRSVLHHLKNLGFIADTDQERIENELLSISGWW